MPNISLETLIITIAVIGSGLLTILFARLLMVESELKLKRYRSKDASLADLLNYAAVIDDGVIVGKDGSLMAAWLYRGADNASSTNEQREAVSTYINKALAKLGSGWMLHIDAVRKATYSYPKAAESNFSDPICAQIDNERRKMFESLGTMYDGYFVLSVTWLPPLVAAQKLGEMMFDDNNTALSKTQRSQMLVTQFKRDIQTLEEQLSISLDLTRLKSFTKRDAGGDVVTYDELLAWLNMAVTGNYHPIVLPKNPIFLDAILGNQELIGGVIPKLGAKYIQTIAIEGFPFESYPGILAELAQLPWEYRFSSRFIFLDQIEAVNHLEKYRKKWQQKVRGVMASVFNNPNAPINQDALAMVDDAESTLADVHSGLVAAGYYTAVVVLRDKDREVLEHAATQVAKAINRLGFTARIETINTLDAFFGSLPSHGVQNIRRPLLNSLNLADLMPTSSIWAGSILAPCPLYPENSPALMQCVTDGATPFRLNLHVRDVGHTLMLGPTGAGKSTHLAMLVAQLRRYQDMTIFAFDKGMSLYPLTAAINATTNGTTGLHFAIAADDSELAFCPLQFLASPSDRAFALEWLEIILNLNQVEITPEQRNKLANALNSMHASNAKTLSEFSLIIQDQAIREALTQYTIDGAMGHLLDAESDGLKLADLTVFEIEDLMNLGDKYALPVLLYIFRRIETALQGQPAAIILDEAWLMLGHKVFKEKIREWLKVLRKANCAVIMATQSLSDATNSGIIDVINESCPTKIFLPNVYARDDDASALYRRMGLNKRQISILADSVPKRDYYYVSPQGRRLYSLALNEFELALVGVSDKEEINHIKQLQHIHGNNWIHIYLEHKHLQLDDYLPSTSQAHHAVNSTHSIHVVNDANSTKPAKQQQANNRNTGI